VVVAKPRVRVVLSQYHSHITMGMSDLISSKVVARGPRGGKV